jgi:hypothetical protein
MPRFHSILIQLNLLRGYEPPVTIGIVVTHTKLPRRYPADRHTNYRSSCLMRPLALPIRQTTRRERLIDGLTANCVPAEDLRINWEVMVLSMSVGSGYA